MLIQPNRRISLSRILVFGILQIAIVTFLADIEAHAARSLDLRRRATVDLTAQTSPSFFVCHPFFIAAP